MIVSPSLNSEDNSLTAVGKLLPYAMRGENCVRR